MTYKKIHTGRHKAIINAGILFIGLLGTNLNEISIKIDIFSFKKMHLKMSSGNWWPFCLGLNVVSSHLPILSAGFYPELLTSHPKPIIKIGHHDAEEIFKIEGTIGNKSVWVLMVAWHWTGDKSLSEQIYALPLICLAIDSWIFHGCIFGIVATDALVLKQQVISICSAHKIFIVLDQFQAEMLMGKTLENWIIHYTVVWELTHLPLVPHICISESGQHWFR